MPPFVSAVSISSIYVKLICRKVSLLKTTEYHFPRRYWRETGNGKSISKLLGDPIFIYQLKVWVPQIASGAQQPINLSEKIKFSNYCSLNCLFLSPDRWNNPPEAARSQPGLANLMAFSFGPHSCPGYRYALLEIKIFIAVLVTHFVFTPQEDRISRFPSWVFNVVVAGIFSCPIQYCYETPS